MSLPELKSPQWPEPQERPVYAWALETAYPNTIGFDQHFALYNSMVDWIKSNVVNYENNALWTKIGDCIYIKLRKPHDATMFLLKFSVSDA